jgi:diguanylate cyclase (GGDEF)-like protein/PAS domain S-box-containing protein
LAAVYILSIFFERQSNSAFKKILEKNEELAFSENRLKDIAFSSSDIIWEIDKDYYYIYAGGGTLDILGYESADFQGKKPFDFCRRDEYRALLHALKKSARGRRVMELTRYCRHKDGRRIMLLTKIIRVVDSYGHLIGYRGVDKDITEWKRSEEALKESENSLRQIINAAPFGAFVIKLQEDGSLVMQNCNHAAETLLNIDFKDYINKGIVELFPKMNGEDISAKVRNLIKKGKSLTIDRLIYERGRDNLIFDFRGLKTGKNGAVLFFYDITERTLREETIKYQAEHDHLTGLANRIVFMKHMQMSFRIAGSKKYILAILFLDLDDFKQVNDTYGHAAGDEILKETARRLKKCLRESDIICRLGGDEFAILLPFIRSRKSLKRIAQKILFEIHEPYRVEPHSILISTSIGISLYPIDGNEPEELLSMSDKALYFAKSQGKNRFCFYCEENGS